MAAATATTVAMLIESGIVSLATHGRHAVEILACSSQGRARNSCARNLSSANGNGKADVSVYAIDMWNSGE